MLLRLTTGDRIPVDGVLTYGEIWLDESMLTGEAIPQYKTVDEKYMPGRWYKMVQHYYAFLQSVNIPP